LFYAPGFTADYTLLQCHKDYNEEQLNIHKDNGGLPFVVIFAPTDGCKILIQDGDGESDMREVEIPDQHVMIFKGDQAHVGCDSAPRIHFYFAPAKINDDENQFIGNYELVIYYYAP
jgi:hypothetical protein